MTKKNKNTKYASVMQEQRHDDQRVSVTTSTEVRSSLEGRATNETGDTPEDSGSGGVSEVTQELDGVGTQDNLGRTTYRFSRLTGVSKMITLPKVTGYALLLFLGILAWYRFYPYDPVSFHTLPIPVLNENHEVRAGEDLLLDMDFEKKSGCQNVESTFYLVDGFVLQMSTSSVNRPVGENDFIREIPIPTSAPVGTNRHIRIEYSCQPNPIRTIQYSWDTEQFNILP